jgi:hypothetical protein
MKVNRDVLRQLPRIDDLVAQIEDEPEEYALKAFEQGPAGVGADIAEVLPEGPRGIVEAELPVSPLADSRERERRELLSAGASGLRKVESEGADADLTPIEALGLEAIVHIEGRPAIFIQGGHFFPPPAGWEVLEDVRDAIESTLKSVGRVEVSGHPSYDWVGTGFLVAPDVIMTNRHVAEVFSYTRNGRKWRFKSGMSGSIDYVEELGALDSAEFALSEVLGVHQEFDMALFRVEQTSSSGATPPQPLSVAAQPPQSVMGRQVYAVGYPAWDGRRNDPQSMQRIFSNVFNVKRLQPGEIMALLESQSLFMHDCSTLGGNSGSCVVDLETQQVVGLHFGGRYLQGNYAVALWALTDDPLLLQAQVHFV